MDQSILLHYSHVPFGIAPRQFMLSLAYKPENHRHPFSRGCPFKGLYAFDTKPLMLPVPSPYPLPHLPIQHPYPPSQPSVKLLQLFLSVFHCPAVASLGNLLDSSPGLFTRAARLSL